MKIFPTRTGPTQAGPSEKDTTVLTTGCPACGGQSAGEMCMHCGEALYPKRISLKHLAHSIPDVFLDLESGLFYTVRKFLLHPGSQIKNYFAGNRSRHMKPLKLILFVSGFFTWLFIKFNIRAGNNPTAFEQFELQWESVILFFQFPVIALITWLAYRKRGYNYAGHLVANAFLIGIVVLFNIVLFPFYYLFNATAGVTAVQGVYFLFVLAYYTYAFYDWFYDRKTTEGFLISIGLVFGILIFTMILSAVFELILFSMLNAFGWV